MEVYRMPDEPRVALYTPEDNVIVACLGITYPNLMMRYDREEANRLCEREDVE